MYFLVSYDTYIESPRLPMPTKSSKLIWVHTLLQPSEPLGIRGVFLVDLPAKIVPVVAVLRAHLLKYPIPCIRVTDVTKCLCIVKILIMLANYIYFQT